MIEKIKLKLIKFVVNKYALGWIISGWELLAGYKSQIFFALSLLTWGGEITGVIDSETALKLYGVFGTGFGQSFMQKLKRYKKYIIPVMEEAREKSK